jgi:hypothetical protein
LRFVSDEQLVYLDQAAQLRREAVDDPYLNGSDTAGRLRLMSEIRLTGYEDDDGAVVGGGWPSDPAVAAGWGEAWQERARLDAAREARAIQAEEAEKQAEAQTRAFLTRQHAGEGRTHQQVLDDARSAFERPERLAARKEREELIAACVPRPVISAS